MADLPKYPKDDFDKGRELLAQLGSFWDDIFLDTATLTT